MKKIKVFLILLLFFIFLVNVFAISLDSKIIKKSSYSTNQKNNFENKIDINILEQFNSGKEKVKVIIKLKDEVEEKVDLLSRAKLKVSKGEFIRNLNIENRVKHKFIYSNAFSAELTKEEIENIIKDDKVEKIYYDFPVYAFLQDSTNIINATSSWNLQVNDINLTGKGQTVCIIDTGIDYNHSDLGGCYGEGCKVIGGYDFVNNDTDPMDDNEHGTHVAGIVAASGKIYGVAPDANLVAIKALDASGSGDFSDVVAGIEWCVSNASIFNISVISMSLGTKYPYLFNNYCDENDTLTAQSINLALSKNISVVIATGNDGYYNAISFPACIYNSTRVTSTNKEDTNISYFANTWNDSSKIILAAPGENINSTEVGSDYIEMSGTSMATPPCFRSNCNNKTIFSINKQNNDI
ncbi:MAG: S8 family serine peptidase [Candidatus Pacearchaeota archaeon]